MIRQSYFFGVIVVLACELFSCSSSINNDQQMKKEEIGITVNDVRDMLNTFPTVVALHFGEESLGPDAASIEDEKPIPREIIEYLINGNGIFDSKDLKFYPGHKLTFNDSISLYTLYTVKNIPYDNITAYVFSVLNKDLSVIDIKKLAYYEEHQEESIIEEGCVYCNPNEIQVGAIDFFY